MNGPCFPLSHYNKAYYLKIRYINMMGVGGIKTYSLIRDNKLLFINIKFCLLFCVSEDLFWLLWTQIFSKMIYFSMTIEKTCNATGWKKCKLIFCSIYHVCLTYSLILNCVQPWPAEVKNWRFYEDFNICHWSGGKSLFRLIFRLNLHENKIVFNNFLEKF